MKTLVSITLLAIALNVQAQSDSTTYALKVSSIDSIVTNLYGVISGEAGEKRDWDLMKYLFKPDAKMIPTHTDREGEHHVNYITPDQYIEKSGAWLEENGFFETEIHRETQQFGNIAHVFSTYECFKSKKDTEPFMRGINSIQLVYDQGRWWVVNIYWAQESEEVPIPKEYLD